MNNRNELSVIELSDEDLSTVSAGMVYLKFKFGDIKGESTEGGGNGFLTFLKFDHEITQPPAGR